MAGKQVRLFLIDGSAGGLITAEIGNWTGHILKGKRPDLGRIRARSEAARTGVYFLFGTSPDGDRLAYIGQSDDVAGRLVNHAANKDFWDEVAIVTSKDANLTSAHVRYLESRLTRIAKSVNRWSLANVQEPSGGAELPEADVSDMDYFIEQVRILMPVLGYDIFRGRTGKLPPDEHAASAAEQETPGDASADSPTFTLRTGRGVDAKAQVLDGEFTVLAGSVIRGTMPRPRGSSDSTARQFASRSVLHAEVAAMAEPLPGTELVRLSKDVVFSSPSSAAAVVQGHATANGRTRWTTANGETYGEWEQSQAGQ